MTTIELADYVTVVVVVVVAILILMLVLMVMACLHLSNITVPEL